MSVLTAKPVAKNSRSSVHQDQGMSRYLVQAARIDAVVLEPAPINPAWIRAGAPLARATQIASSADGAAFTAVWDCTEGSFDWHFGCDETVHILEGEVIVTEPGQPPRTLRVGDVALFPAGLTAHWQVPRYVRKLAFMRQPFPRSIHAARRIASRVQVMLRRLRASFAKLSVGGSLAAERWLLLLP
jgi:uncharacterized cupin superfamily protein